MKKIIKTASLLTSGIIVGALVRKFAFQSTTPKAPSGDSVKSVKNIFNSSTGDDGENYFV
ncbi:MAG: hypothetical protein HC819_06690 [Cyclobacteriaceae bacterium]|nr:hypothetical protein [Cyclobacteriaceae bacterium]